MVAEFERPVMLYSIGKDSSMMLRLAQKAFHPGPIPFPLLHVDTTSEADTVPKIIDELIATRHSERQLRIIDHDQDGSMEVKKREGYF